MLNPSCTLIAALIALPMILSQSSNTNDTTATNASSTPPSPGSATFAPTNFTPSLASATVCGTTQQNFNQCITKVGRDISSCTDNVCLCQTYANIAACYNGCAELSAQGQAYQAQSAQYCQIAGVRPNTTTTTVTPTTTNPSPSPTPNTTPVRTGPINNATTNASTFSAAKSVASSQSAASLIGLCFGLAGALVAVIA